MSPLAPFALELERSRRPVPAVPSGVSPRLTPPAKRRKRERAPIECTDYAAMMRRMLLAHGRRVAVADVEDLADLIALEAVLAEAIAHAVTESSSGEAVEVDRRYGAWFAERRVRPGARTFVRVDVTAPVAAALQARVRTLELAEARELEALEEAAS